MDFIKFQSEILNTLDLLKKQVDSNTRKLDELETYSRRNCLIFHGISGSKHESHSDLEEKVLELICKLNIPDWLPDGSIIDRGHRLGKWIKSKQRPVIVKFTSYRHRSKVWLNKKYLKGSGSSISESLTGRRLILYQESKEFFGKENVWTSDGTICIRLNGRVCRVQYRDELDELKSQIRVGDNMNVDGAVSDVRRTRANSRKVADSG